MFEYPLRESGPIDPFVQRILAGFRESNIIVSISNYPKLCETLCEKIRDCSWILDPSKFNSSNAEPISTD